MNKMEKLEAAKKMINLLSDLEELKSKLGINEPDCCDDESCCGEEEEDKDADCPIANKLGTQYQEITKWAFGSLETDGVLIKDLLKRWKKEHPDLPELEFSHEVRQDLYQTIFMMQIAPHWERHKAKAA